MTSCEPVREELLGPEEMGQIGTRKSLAEQARTVVLDGRRVVEEPLVAEIQSTAWHPQLTVPRDPGRQDRVEQVDASMHGFQ